MKYNINIDRDNRIFRYTHSGSVSKESIGLAWQELLATEEFVSGKYNMLSDYRNAIFNMKAEDIDEITDFLFDIKHILYGKKQALVVKDPVTTAFSMLFESKVIDKVGFNVQVFSNIDAAIQWLTK